MTDTFTGDITHITTANHPYHSLYTHPFITLHSHPNIAHTLIRIYTNEIKDFYEIAGDYYN